MDQINLFRDESGGFMQSIVRYGQDNFFINIFEV